MTGCIVAFATATHVCQMHSPPWCSQQQRQWHSLPSSLLQPFLCVHSHPQLLAWPGQVVPPPPPPPDRRRRWLSSWLRCSSFMLSKTVGFMLQLSGAWHAPPSSQVRSFECQASNTNAIPSSSACLMLSRLFMDCLAVRPSWVNVMWPFSTPPSTGNSILNSKGLSALIVYRSPGPKSLPPLPNFTMGLPPWLQLEGCESWGGL
mmetsp:Transcript_9050/g.23194  ORF Transcript_9050/g.23194 Transcript_9050/m.23194 type:complete len:204 (+) Transcript_9050:15-626(+)